MPRPFIHRRRAPLACATVMLLAWAAHAQPRPLKDPTPLPGAADSPYKKEQFLPLFEDLSYAQARVKANKQNRWLIVFYDGRGIFRPFNLARLTRSASLRAWIAWHAVSIRDTASVPSEIARQRFARLAPGTGDPCVLFIRNDIVEAAIGSERDGRFEETPSRNDANAIATGSIARTIGQPTPVRVLFTGSVQYDAVAARDPVWRAMHDHKNPPPQPPDLGPPMHAVTDDNAPAISDPSPPAPDERISVLDRLAQARALVRSGDLYQATGVYTWLWERAEALDPAFRPARLSTLAAEMRALGTKRPASAQRFTHLRARSERTILFDLPGLAQEHLALCALTDDQAEVISFLAYFADDPDESSITPVGQRTVYDLLARRDPDYISPSELPANPSERLARIARTIDRPRPAGADPVDWSRTREFARRYLLDEACRLYAAALLAGKPDQADLVASLLLKHADTPLSRRSLVTTALALDPPRPQPVHARWLSQARAAGDLRTQELEVRLDAALRAAP